MDRQCKKCTAVKPIEQFVKRAKCKDGYGYTCKECTNEKNLEWYHTHKDEVSQYKKFYHEVNKESINQYKHEYYMKNRDVILQKQKDNRIMKRQERITSEQTPLKEPLLLENPKSLDPSFRSTTIMARQCAMADDAFIKSLKRNQLTVSALKVIAEKYCVKLRGTTKDKMIEYLVDIGVLSPSVNEASEVSAARE